jgi:signal transduction histidine kinase
LEFGLQPRGTPLFSPLAALLIAAGIFAFDALTPFDVAIAVLYVSVVMLSLSFASRRGMLWIAAGCMALTLISFFVSHAANPTSGAAARCAVSLSAIAITAFLALKVRDGIAVLERSKARYRNIFLASGTAIVEMDFSDLAKEIDRVKAEGFATMRELRAARPEFGRKALDLIRITNANQTTLKLFAADSVDALRHAFTLLIPYETEDAVWALLDAVAEGRPNFEAETIMLALGGRRVDVICTFAMPPVDPPFGQVLVSFMDVTARREAEYALQKAQAELAHVSRVATLGELTASIAHEVNQPLAAIVTNGQAGLRWAGRDQPDLGEVRSSLERMIADAKRASDVIQRLRSLSSNGAPQQTSLDINEVAEETLVLVQREIAAHQVMLHLDLDRAVPPTIGDRVQLQQVFLNLMMNAIQAMSAAGGPARTLTLRSRGADGMVVFSVEDTGPGFPDGVPDRLFNPFYTTKANGMGMGLSICRSIVEAHGGRIRATAGIPTGAIFEVAFPSHREAA